MVTLFEDIPHGSWRMIYLHRPCPVPRKPDRQGDSIGHRVGNTRSIDAAGFNDLTWLNATGLRHSARLQGGAYVRYVVTATDPAVLKQPYR
jgi:hypothetical protein